ncbi:protein phosphatase 2C domain-containing protein [Streptomyces sp. S07_1.15]|uniref:protein phosphatase 2C domain-containing protein n=1 Tax=Streptomyces sp. S07_1.15 TaxID=2873925 RepID=UPI001D13FF4A|nr:protein phosphatase 2C domain-containing protein [Streptomyces sp. S07_1.15]MCC3653387.1 protein phosphatase 2C domain-containing protein [Streptomyces sp. S07_1.15]
MDKWLRFRRDKSREDEQRDTPESPDIDPAGAADRQPPGPRQAEAGHTPAPRGGGTAPPSGHFSDYMVPEYRVEPYVVPEYDGPALESPSSPGPGTGQRSAPPRQQGSGQVHGMEPQGIRDPPVAPPQHTPAPPPYAPAPPQQAPAPPQYAPAPPQQALAPPQQAPAPRHASPDGQAGAPPQHGSAPRHAAPGAPEPGADRAAPDSRRGTNRYQRVVLGKPSAHVEPKPPPGDPYRPDTLFDGWSAPELTVRLASVRGDQHRFDGRPRQDDVVVAWHEPSATVVFAVADGVSAAAQSHVGAALVCRTAVNDLLVQLGEDRPGPDWTRVLQAARYQLLMRVARGREPDEGDLAEAARTLATTLVAGTVAPAEGGGMHVTLACAGDSSAWCLQQGRFNPLLSDKNSGSGEITSNAVVALPRLSTRSRPLSYTLPADGVLLVGTDGFGDPLGDGSGMVGELFAELAVHPPEPRGLAHLLDFSRETFDDDRTLLAVWPRHRLSSGAP